MSVNLIQVAVEEVKPLAAWQAGPTTRCVVPKAPFAAQGRCVTSILQDLSHGDVFVSQ